MKKSCPECGGIVKGRSDKVYCSSICKNSYHQEKRQHKNLLFKSIDHQLKLNRRILKAFNKAGKSTARAEHLISEGFNPNYFTHYWKNAKGDVYLFVYEFGFLKLKEHNKDKYLLIKWQDYMNFKT